MKKFNAQKALAHLLLVGLITTAIFPGTAYAAEVGEQMAEGQQTVMEAVASEKEQQDLVTENTDQAQNEPTQENGQTEDAASSPTVTEYTSADQVLDASAVAGEDTGRRLILTADTLPEEIYEANNVEHYDDLYLLTYETKEACAFAYDAFVSAGYVVEKDDLLDAIDQDEIPETKVQDEVTAETIDDPVPTVGTKQTLVAVIDTGISDVTNDDVFKDRIIEGTSVISDSYVDDNGHGTAMAKIIAEDTADENVMLLPIKALDKDGKGTVLSVALAIKYAKEHGADVINLSLSGVGQSNVLTNAINDCYNNNITVVTAAGNDNADAKDYIPGNVDTAINVAAVDKDTDGKIVSATYTNHGDNVDFAALGIYHLSVDKDEVSLETELRGTSIASAHVTAYVAMLKQINAEVSETDVMESLKASATDLGEEGIDPYFGNGFLAKENLVFLNSDVEDQDKEIDVPETDTDGDQNISTANYWDGNGIWHITTEEGFNGAVNYANSIGPISVVLDTTFAVWGNYVISGSAMSINGNGNAISFHGNGEKIISINQDLSMANIVLDGWNCSSSGNTSYTVGLSKMNGNLYVDNVTFQGFGNGRSNSYNAIGLRAIYGANVHANRCKFNDISSYGLCIDCSKNPFWILSNDDALPATGTITNCSASGCGKGMSTIRQATFDTCSATNCDIGISLGASQKWFSNPCVTGNLTATAKNCTVSNCTTTGISGGYNAIVTGCTVSGCDNGIGMGGRNGDTVKISSNTVYNCTYGLNTWSPDLNCSNNTFCNNTDGVLVQKATTYENKAINPTLTASGNNIYSNKDGIDNKGTLYFKSGNVYSNTYGGRNYGTLHMSGGSIYSNTYDGIRNAGTLNISGGTIRNNESGVANGIYDEDRVNKSGTLNMTGGTITGNTMDGIYNRFGTATITGGSIKDNQRYGTYNKATMNYTGGSSGGNSGYDVYQKGNYKMSGSASTYSNGVFLAKGKIIEITGPLTCTDGAIKVTIQRLDSTVGRTVAKCTYGMNKANADAMLGKFALQNKETRTIGADGKTFRKAALRSATGTNGSIGNIVLSEKYYVTYDGNVQNAHVTFDLPARQTIYWKEDADVPTVGTTAYYDGRVFQSLRNIGYSKTTDGSGAACGVGQTMHFAANEVTKDQVLYALYTTAADLAINGNTQTAGDDYVIHGFVSNETALPDNTFEKIYSGIEYDENLEKDIPYKTVYSHHGWSYSDQAMYKDSGVGKCGETFDLTPRILEMLQQGQESVSEEGYINNLTLYAVWDEPPKITAMNKYWNTDAIRAGKLNKEDLLRTASAKDKEDGTDVTLEVEDFDIEKFLHLGEYGWMSVRYKATDGAGNVSYKLIKVVVVQSGIVQGEFYDPNPAYVRMIDRENYNKKSHEEGGLMEDSVWYTIPTYKKTILDAFDRLDNGEAIVRYHFSCKDIREAQAYETEAMENGTYPTAAHWEAWLKKFEHCKVFDTGYRSSKELNNSINPEDYEDYEESEE